MPEIYILEYSIHSEYTNALKKGYNIVGYSLYVNEIRDIIDMIKIARRTCEDVEIWDGNYGALTQEIQSHFDELMVGYSDERIAAKLGMKIERIRHPPLVWYFQTSLD